MTHRNGSNNGPNAVNSAFYNSFLDRMLMGKAPQSLGKVDVKHTYAYSLDNCRALVALALDDDTYGQAWHLPVGEPVTINEVLAVFNKVMGSNHKVSAMPSWLLGIISKFSTKPIPMYRNAKSFANTS